MISCAHVAAAQEITGYPNETVAFNRGDRDAAIREIPFDKLTMQAGDDIRYVVTSPSIFRRLPVQVIDCDPDLYLLLVRYPEIIVNIWRLMGITNVAIERTGQFSFHAKDGAGTVSDVELVYGNRDTHILIANGYYEGPLAPGKVDAKCVLVLKTGYAPADMNKTFVSNQLDVFVKFEHKGADLLARTLHPLIGKTADANFAETTAFLGKISKSSEENFTGMQNLSQKLTQIDPALRDQFVQATHRVYQRSQAAQQKVGAQAVEMDTTSVATDEDSPRPFVAQRNEGIRPLSAEEPEEVVIVPVEIAGPFPRKRTADLRR
ncbi:hypothetical protein LOC68_05585 [Blastopirellula sp. JC732]|uniref:Uncharacterized protein n=1 Tax=Blastopirellula sediminis TaxID=2894196 RepID=A0A9X1MLT5_9BACT|nr:hypothetical protein [Blastopirellula sediminis]MCC9609364.1 hypothetical protein [Blastopirellula sediminis]MCC9627859.1 hypothetical protein [Blastopirellula sediminis]